MRARFMRQQAAVKIVERDGKAYVYICLNEEQKTEDFDGQTETYYEYDYNEIIAPTDELPIEEIRKNPEKYLEYAYTPGEKPLTEEEALALAKQEKIARSKVLLAEHLERNPITSTAHGGEAGVYSVTEEKQQLMALNYNTYQIKKASGLDATLTWNETGKGCEVWTEPEYVQLILEIEMYVKPLVSMQQSYENLIANASTLEEVEAIEIVY